VFEVTRAIRRAAADENVRGLVMHVGPIGWGWATIEEVRAALEVFSESGKPLYASIAYGGEREYLLASSAGTLAMQPVDPLYLDGLAAGAMFFRGTLDKLGVTPNFEHVGEFKSAVEQYTRKDLSPAGREAQDAVIDDLYGAFLEAAAVSRDVDAAEMRRRVEAGPYLPADAVSGGEARLVARHHGERGHPGAERSREPASRAAAHSGRRVRGNPRRRQLDR
jgi:protease-4